MAITHEVWVRCDGDELSLCDEEVVVQGATASQATTRVVLDKARAQGWMCSKGLHLCPQHRTDTLAHVLETLDPKTTDQERA